MNSPVKQIRNSYKLSVNQLANNIGVDSQVIYHLEDGVYVKIPPRVNDYLVEVLGAKPHTLRSHYSSFRRRKRKKFKDKYTLPVARPDLGKSPLTLLRENLNLSKADFVREACVEPAVLYMVESGRVSRLPDSLRAALIECGMSLDDVNELEEHQYEFTCHFNKLPS